VSRAFGGQAVVRNGSAGRLALPFNCPVAAKGIFRLIQSIPSPKAEPFQRWRTKVS
jgi:hypothetical protein